MKKKTLKCPKCKKKAYRKIFFPKGDDYFHDAGPIIRNSCFVDDLVRAAFFQTITDTLESLGFKKLDYMSIAYREFIDAWHSGRRTPYLTIKKHLKGRRKKLVARVKELNNLIEAIDNYK